MNAAGLAGVLDAEERRKCAFFLERKGGMKDELNFRNPIGHWNH
jgi:hypothetical protein